MSNGYSRAKISHNLHIRNITSSRGVHVIYSEVPACSQVYVTILNDLIFGAVFRSCPQINVLMYITIQCMLGFGVLLRINTIILLSKYIYL